MARPRQGLSVDAVVRVAVELADSDGVEALTSAASPAYRGPRR
ncbi:MULTISPECIES: hypothetical protein [unclassified Streptomyces]|nr:MULTISPECIES: hypothetical protein [unclassified Streptomyces]